jgi:hypothetical protein
MGLIWRSVWIDLGRSYSGLVRATFRDLVPGFSRLSTNEHRNSWRGFNIPDICIWRGKGHSENVKPKGYSKNGRAHALSPLKTLERHDNRLSFSAGRGRETISLEDAAPEIIGARFRRFTETSTQKILQFTRRWLPILHYCCKSLYFAQAQGRTSTEWRIGGIMTSSSLSYFKKAASQTFSVA